MRARVASDTPSSPRSARLTDIRLTPAAAATSRMPARAERRGRRGGLGGGGASSGMKASANLGPVTLTITQKARHGAL